MALGFWIAGVGAVGGTIAARLAAHGQDVSLVARGARGIATGVEESLRVAAAFGVGASMSLAEMIATGRRGGAFETSMLQDYRAGRMLELDAIGRAVLDPAGLVNVNMPTSEVLIALCAHRAARRS
jgi:2-dehydropantoate 2-reductase